MEAQESGDESRWKLEETEKRVQLLQESLKGLEEKMTNLESENKVFRQQAVSMRTESGCGYEDSRMHVDLHSPSMNQRDLPEAEDKPQKSLNEKQQENQEFLIRCILQNLGFLGNRPIAACTIYKCLLHWRSFEVERTTVFDRIIQTIGHAIEKMQDSNDVLAYWLSNASTPLLLLQRTLKESAAAAMTPLHRRSSSASLFGRMSQSFRGNPQGVNLSFVTGGVETLRQVPCHVVQSASYRICGENLWNDSRQFEGGDFSIAGFMYPGTTNVKSKLG